MKKNKQHRFVCEECGNTFHKWMGQCTGCGKWNTVIEIEEKAETESKFAKSSKAEQNLPQKISEIENDDLPRIATGFSEVNRVLGGGLLQGSLSLLGGDPGIGKSTLLIQIAAVVSQNTDVLYISGEESNQQIKNRANRLNIDQTEFYVYTETSLDAIITQIAKLEPRLVIIDSIQTIFQPEVNGLPGSFSQVREAAIRLLRTAKDTNTSIWLIGHVTKEGSIAGPRVLEHIVDTVLYLEGDPQHEVKLIRAVKNRFGPTDEVGVLKMSKIGMQDVENVMELFLTNQGKPISGTAISCIHEGTRPLMIEIQALVSSSFYTMPKRQADGFDANRLLKIIAVMEKRLKIGLADRDIYVAIVGGLRIKEPAIDLAIASAIYSSLKNIPMDRNTVYIGEIGLTGEVRQIPHVVERISEAKRLGFQKIFCAKPIPKEINKDGINAVESLYQIFND